MNKKPISYLQTDARWKSKPYRVKGETSTIGSAGCGPTAAAMLIETITGKTFTPVDACAWSIEHGYKALRQGTYYSYFKPQFAAFGINCDQLNWQSSYGKPDHPNHEKVVEMLKEGYYFIALMGPGRWTTSGHFVVLWWQDGKVRINDPASTKTARLEGDIRTFRSQAKYYWWIDARAFNRGVTTTDQPLDIGAAITKLHSLGVVNNPDYWLEAATNKRLDYLDALITKAAVKITKAAARTSTVDEAITALVAAKVINTPDYWRKHQNDVPNLPALLCALGGALKQAQRTYTVKPGESLWAIAAKQLGNGSRYKEIKALNGLTNDTIHAGQVLTLPAE